MKTFKYICIISLVFGGRILPLASNFSNQDSVKLKNLLQKSEQVIIVVSKDWNAPVAEMSYYERSEGKLKAVSEGVHVFLGKAGLGWGKGLIDFSESNGPTKKEGDKRSPAGVFSLPYVFGLLPVDSLKWLKFPYQQISKLNECVDDTASDFYNKIVNTLEKKKTWRSSENMDDPDYKYGIVISHNSSPVEKGCGSCIFFHLTGPKPKPTAGCTAMNEESLLKLLHWIDVKKRPLLIQLPKSEFEKIKLLFR